MFTKGLDLDAIEQVVNSEYHEQAEDDDGEEVIDFAEYDDGILYTEMAGDLETETGDELSCEEITGKIDGDESDAAKFVAFLRKEVLDKGIPLILVDSHKNRISQIDEGSLDGVVEQHKEQLSINIREYDYESDY